MFLDYRNTKICHLVQSITAILVSEAKTLLTVITDLIIKKSQYFPHNDNVTKDMTQRKTN